MYIIAAGNEFNDIDAFACAIAYAELLRQEGKEATSAMIGTLNHSITKLTREQNGAYIISCTPAPDDLIVYVDISNPAYFAFPTVPASQIFEVYDHHYGWETYWQEHLGNRAHIERVGAAATLIWEEWKKRALVSSISPASANLLLLAILQNTLNFTSTETTARDTAAFEELKTYSSLPDDWQNRYFAECAEDIHTHVSEVLKHDTKTFSDAFGSRLFVFSQLEIMEDPHMFLDQYRANIDAYWGTFPGARCLINIADMRSQTSLLYSNDTLWLNTVVAPLFGKPPGQFVSSITIPIHQRKQILKRLQEHG